MQGSEALRAVLATLLGMEDAKRLYRVELPGESEPVLVDRWCGRERLSAGFSGSIEVLSLRADLDLEAWLGRSMTLWTRLADGTEQPRSGVVREATCIGGDGGLARYRIELAPWTWLVDQSLTWTVGETLTLASGQAIRLAVAGGASLTLRDGHIELACPGTITVQASKKTFEGPAQLSREMNSWPESRFDKEIVLKDRATGEPIARRRFEIIREDGARLHGVTDAQGRTGLQRSQMMGNYRMHIYEDDQENHT